MTNIKLKHYDVEELAAHILGLGEDYEYDTIEELLFEKYEVSFESFHKIIETLIPLCEVAKSPITDVIFRGFADREKGFWLTRITD